LDRLDIDTILLTDSLLEGIEGTDSGQTLSASYQFIKLPELAQAIEASGKEARDFLTNSFQQNIFFGTNRSSKRSSGFTFQI